MRRILIGALLCAALALPAEARNFAVPPKNPAMTVVVPDSWKVREIDFGFSARSPDDEVVFYVEYASKKKLDAMLETNRAWMRENEIDDSVKPLEKEMDFNGASGTVLRYDTKDANGKTIVDFVLLSGGENQVIMLTLWGSEEERASHKAEISAIMNSVRPIK
ncbi:MULTISPECIES: hypothetical protein [Methylobacterium]|uniref:hypothetical protein n=1 Tax=Methylobacterium TaxID=407 RepID=UPI001053D131|nr:MULTISPECIES: hypothetical protein [Methylobacterium]MDR7037312.1 phosphotransferase system HPr-like phosphotransfer protein [Methylobacterium sp. BE186]